MLKLPLLVDLQQKVGELVKPYFHDFLSFNNYFKKYFKFKYRKMWLW
jgi:hypothetical protein